MVPAELLSDASTKSDGFSVQFLRIGSQITVVVVFDFRCFKGCSSKDPSSMGLGGFTTKDPSSMGLGGFVTKAT